MASIHERTLKMMREYVKLRSKGMTPKQIAKKFNLSPYTVYHHLDDIAKSAGVSRESLLVQPEKESISYEREFAPVEPVDITSFKEHFNKTLKSMEDTRKAMERYLAEQETLAEKYAEEEEAWQQQ